MKILTALHVIGGLAIAYGLWLYSPDPFARGWGIFLVPVCLFGVPLVGVSTFQRWMIAEDKEFFSRVWETLKEFLGALVGTACIALFYLWVLTFTGERFIHGPLFPSSRVQSKPASVDEHDSQDEYENVRTR